MTPRASDPRRHHYVPVFHLRGYTGPDGRVFMLDREEGRVRPAAPAAVAREHDYYRVDGAEDPLAVERAFRAFEAKAADAMGRARASTEFPKDEDLFDLLEHAALQATRVPSLREPLREAQSGLARGVLEIVAHDEERFESVLRRMRADGAQVPADASWAAFRRALPEILVEPTRGPLVRTALGVAPAVLDTLMQRQWVLGIVGFGCGHLITSDNPVVVVPTPGFPAAGLTPAFGMPHTRVVIPVARDRVLLGEFEAAGGSVVDLDVRQVAQINSAVALRAKRFIFSPRPRFRFMYRGQLADDVERFHLASRPGSRTGAGARSDEG